MTAPGSCDPLTGSHHGMHRAVLNTYFPMAIRRWAADLVAPLHNGSDDQLDSTHLMRMAGRSARQLRASPAAHGIDCTRGERKNTGSPRGT